MEYPWNDPRKPSWNITSLYPVQCIPRSFRGLAASLISLYLRPQQFSGLAGLLEGLFMASSVYLALDHSTKRVGRHPATSAYFQRGSWRCDSEVEASPLASSRRELHYDVIVNMANRLKLIKFQTALADLRHCLGA